MHLLPNEVQKPPHKGSRTGAPRRPKDWPPKNPLQQPTRESHVSGLLPRPTLLPLASCSRGQVIKVTSPIQLMRSNRTTISPHSTLCPQDEPAQRMSRRNVHSASRFCTCGVPSSSASWQRGGLKRLATLVHRDGDDSSKRRALYGKEHIGDGHLFGSHNRFGCRQHSDQSRVPGDGHFGPVV